jgi:CheY-like chemotaxis protein
MEKRTFDLGGKKLLVVDDDPVVRLLLKITFTSWRNTLFDLAADGAAALKRVAATGYDLILMDLQMPVLDGFETARAIRSGQAGFVNQKIPIIAISADLSEAARTKCLSLGIDEFLLKPLDSGTLHGSIQCLLGNQLPPGRLG